jgi:hypothetical protein
MKATKEQQRKALKMAKAVFGIKKGAEFPKNINIETIGKVTKIRTPQSILHVSLFEFCATVLLEAICGYNPQKVGDVMYWHMIGSRNIIDGLYKMYEYNLRDLPKNFEGVQIHKFRNK